VQRQGNPRARKIISEVFSRDDALWRGLGRIPKSGLSIKENFAQFDAARIFNFRHLIDENKSKQNLYAGEGQRTAECKCADILKGIISPPDCPLFSLACSPQHPLGPCMVSSEGACNAYYRYR
jgi:hydrogenase expression/formation protein HypD